MALRCRAAALYVDDELDLHVQQLTTTLFPPRNMEDAEALATGGNTAVPFLRYDKNLEAMETAASVRALRLIGTSQARQALSEYLGDRRLAVLSELAQAVNPLEIEWVQEQLLAAKLLPPEIAAQVADLSPLTMLPNLQSINLRGTQVEDLSALANLSSLQSIDLFRTKVADLSPLATLTNLRSLDLFETLVEDLSPLAKLTNLQSLDLFGTKVADLSPLAALVNLERLHLTGTQVEDLSPLVGLSKLRWLDIRNTRITANSSGVLKHLACAISL
jgi:Leucine-rich repeat (LRR) protein